MILIVQSLWNEAITSKLCEGAAQYLKSKKIPYEIVQVPGALEIPLAIAYRAKKKPGLKGAVCVGTVVKGETFHFEIVANESARALTQLSMDLMMPIGHGILATYDVDQALERAGGKYGNKGEEAARAVVSMLQWMKSPVRKKK
jgi:6,7-dimethyl-8-ribityllumazine synthase